VIFGGLAERLIASALDTDGGACSAWYAGHAPSIRSNRIAAASAVPASALTPAGTFNHNTVEAVPWPKQPRLYRFWLCLNHKGDTPWKRENNAVLK
jgi:hypothetical protein